MTVLLFERNLLWSVRLANALRALGHEAHVRETVGEEAADLAVVNLSETDRVERLVADLKARAIPILAHAGHREKELMALGKRLGVDRLATNGQLATDLANVLARLFPEQTPESIAENALPNTKE